MERYEHIEIILYLLKILFAKTSNIEYILKHIIFVLTSVFVLLLFFNNVIIHISS